ncbi:MAG TPA: hypothetical protein DHD79_03245 [Firmicutes bacterium]|nr:hypothetical protein [Bacillota bacterium]HAW71358.1 hypothetical protein [Bacillota bacterium]HAZ22222.1 hypothetical protein [Bacillota bacterium]HBE05535.1 hypothetical protein [Bacillota bacterium]HBL50916.1 hypothetical protein [Bacillota bacterium]
MSSQNKDYHNGFRERLQDFFEDTTKKLKELPEFSDILNSGFFKDDLLKLRLAEVFEKTVAIEERIRKAVSSVRYDDQKLCTKDFRNSSAKSVADLISETWANCMFFAECHKILSSVPCPMPRSAVMANMGLGQNSYLSRFAPIAYKTSLELFQLNRFLDENTDNIDAPMIGSHTKKLPPLPEQATVYLGKELADLADEFNRWSYEFCAFVEGMASCGGNWDSLRREVTGALLCLHQLQSTFVRSEALWSKRTIEAMSED